MSATSEQVLAVLQSIDATLKQMLAQTRANVPKTVATDRDLDGKYGDPELKFMPRDWTGESFKGFHFSECPASLLDMVAETFDYFAGQAEAKNELTTSGKPAAPYKRMDAARARGWAARARAGRVPSRAPQPPADDTFGAPAAASGDFSDADIPF